MAQAISENVAPVFEQEANRHLTVYFPPCLQGCRVTDFRGREIVQGDTVIKQLDSFAYMQNDTLAMGREARTNGLSLLVPGGVAFQAAAPAPDRNLQGSPGVGPVRIGCMSVILFCPLLLKVSCSLLLRTEIPRFRRNILLGKPTQEPSPLH